MKVVITGGHHTSALPVISELRKTLSDCEIYWLGHKHSVKGDKNLTLEYKDITSLQIPFYELKAGKFYRTYNPTRLLKIPFGFLQSLVLLRRLRPDVVLSFGGYLAVPVVFCAWLLRIPSYTHEQTVVAGYANRFISRFVGTVFVSWEESVKYFKNKRVILTGLPLREEIGKVSSSSFDTNEKLPTIYITAGKTGSHIINKIVEDILPVLLNKANVIHQCGDTSTYSDFDSLYKTYSGLRPRPEGKYFLRKFVLADEIGEAFTKADMVVSRSGAHTVSEIIYLEKPTLFIPIPWVSHNEQYENAKTARALGLAEIIDQEDLNDDTLLAGITCMLENLADYKLADKRAKELFAKNPQNTIVQTILFDIGYAKK